MNEEEPAPESPSITQSHSLLSTHSVLATYAGTHTRPTLLEPNTPRVDATWADFNIVEYTKYEKRSVYGDDQLEEIAFQPREQSEDFNFALSSLVAGDQVWITWEHRYVTENEQVSSSHESSKQWAERVVTYFEK